MNSEEKLLRIRQRERWVTLHDLKILLVKNIDSGYRLTIRVKQHGLHPELSGYIRGFLDSTFDTVLISPTIDDRQQQPVDVQKIELIEFDFGYLYQGLSSKVFWVK